MLNCRETRTAIEMSTGRQGLESGAAAHLGECADCGDYAASTFMLMGLLGGQPRVEAPADFDFHLRARIARARDEKHGWRETLAEFWSRAFSWKEATVAVAALVAVASTATFYVTRDTAPVAPQTLVATTLPRIVTPTPETAPKGVVNSDVLPQSGAPLSGGDVARVEVPQIRRAPGAGLLRPVVARELAGVREVQFQTESSGTQEILIYQPGRGGNPGAARSVIVPRRGQVAFGAQLASTHGALGSRSGAAQSTVETF